MSTMTELLTGDDPVVLDGAALQTWTPREDFAVSAAQVAAYSAAIGDTWEHRLAGHLAAPTFAFAPFTALLRSALVELVGDAGLLRLVHTHQDFRLFRPLAAGDRVVTTGRVTRLVSGPFGAVVELVADITADDGTLVTSQTATCLVAGSTCINPIEQAQPEVAQPEVAQTPERLRPTGTANLTIPADLTPRYAQASGDDNPIHLVPELARAIGFPGVIVHGVATLAMAVHALEQAFPTAGTPDRLRVEFARPVFPGDRLTVRWQENTADDGATRLRFEVLNRRRRTVLRAGLLTLRPDEGPSSDAG